MSTIHLYWTAEVLGFLGWAFLSLWAEWRFVRWMGKDKREVSADAAFAAIVLLIFWTVATFILFGSAANALFTGTAL